MSVDVAAVIAADKATTEAATAGPWFASDRGVGWEIFLDELGEGYGRKPDGTWARVLPEGMRTSIGEAGDAQFIAAARSRWPVYIAAIEAVTELHSPEQHRRQVPVVRTVVETITRCKSCHETWPCATIRALAVLAPSTDKEQQ